MTVFFAIGPARMREAFSRATKIGFGGLEIEFRSEIEAAAKARKIDLPPRSRDELARRLARLKHLISATRVLWIDNQPTGNTIEIGLLKSLGAEIDLATSDVAARERLSGAVYDLVLSDMDRSGDNEAGIKFLSAVKSAILSPPIIFYVGKARDVPQGAFGLTVRPDELFHLILDALERRKA